MVRRIDLNGRWKEAAVCKLPQRDSGDPQKILPHTETSSFCNVFNNIIQFFILRRTWGLWIVQLLIILLNFLRSSLVLMFQFHNVCILDATSHKYVHYRNAYMCVCVLFDTMLRIYRTTERSQLFCLTVRRRRKRQYNTAKKENNGMRVLKCRHVVMGVTARHSWYGAKFCHEYEEQKAMRTAWINRIKPTTVRCTVNRCTNFDCAGIL